MIITIKLTAYECGVPGLAAHTSTDGEGWAITHLRSGLAIAQFRDATDVADLLGAAADLAKLTDWTQSGADITDEVTTAEVVGAISPHGGVVPYGNVATLEERADLAEVPGA